MSAWLVGLPRTERSASRSCQDCSCPRVPAPRPAAMLLLRLERIGDLLMSVGAITGIRRRLPGATIDLVVGSWNEALARLTRR